MIRKCLQSVLTFLDGIALEIRVTMIRWINLAHALAVGELYEKKPNEFSSLDTIRDVGLLTDREYQYMVETPRCRYVTPFVWVLDLAREVQARELFGVTQGMLYTFEENVQKVRSGLGQLCLYRDTPVPLCYRQLVIFTVRVYMIVVCFAGGFASIENFGNAENQGTVIVSSAFLWFALPFCFEYFLFVGWLTIADALANPFRKWSDEFEWEKFVKSAYLSSHLQVARTTGAFAARAGDYGGSSAKSTAATHQEWE